MDSQSNPINLKNIPIKKIYDLLLEEGEPRFRAQQIIKWIYQKQVDSFDLMNNISKTTRQKLSEKYSIVKLPVEFVLKSKYHDSVKFGFKLSGTSYVIESVLLYDGKRRTACISSQLGCALNCSFCETGRLGFIRNLTISEIIGQVIGINDFLLGNNDKLVTNIVFMGMGEALSNYDNFKATLEILMDEDSLNIGARHITVSTAGVISSIERLLTEDLNIGLAISLNAHSNDFRNTIMPINKRFPIEKLIQIAQQYFNRTGRRVTFEYVVINGQNDGNEAASALQRLLGSFPCKINLIPLNQSSAKTFEITDEKSLERFAEELHRRGLSVTTRKSRGRDILGACGQLTAKILDSKNNQG